MKGLCLIGLRQIFFLDVLILFVVVTTRIDMNPSCSPLMRKLQTLQSLGMSPREILEYLDYGHLKKTNRGRVVQVIKVTILPLISEERGRNMGWRHVTVSQRSPENGQFTAHIN